MSLVLPVEGVPGVHDLIDRRAQRRHRLHARSGHRPRAGRGAADRPADARRLQRRRRRGVRRAQRRVAPSAQLSIGEIIARHQQQQRAQDALVQELHRARADGAALPADGHRSGLRRRHREPLLRRRRRRRVGGAVVLGERLEVGRRPPAVSAAAAGEGAVAAAAAAVRRGLSLPAGRHGARRRLRLLRRAVRAGASGQRRSTAARSGSTGKTFARIRVQAVQSGLAGAGRLERGDAATTRRSIGRQPAGVPVQRPDRAADRADRRPQPAGREDGRRSRDFQRQRRRVRARARVGARRAIA